MPKVRLESFKDFTKHYLMIVLSILTALGLEAWIGHAHHRQAAAQASRRMDDEWGEAIAAIEESAAINQKELTALPAFDAPAASDLGAGLDSAAIHRQIQDRRADYQLNAS